MMQSNEYISVYDDYNGYQQQQNVVDNAGMLIVEGSSGQHVESSPAANNNMIGGILEDDGQTDNGGLGLENSNAATAAIDFNDPKIASLPRILLMGPRRGGKTSIQVRAVEMK
jgi:hypothetical protein